MIVIIDYGMGNLGSIYNMLRKINVKSIISSKKEDLQNASKLILPGVGAFDNGMKNLLKLDIIPTLEDKVVNQKTPFLGICLGMHLITKNSHEGSQEGLGWIDAETKKFDFTKKKDSFRVPHMGWNTVNVIENGHRFFSDLENPRFYFVHSYHVICNNRKDVLADTFYGYRFDSVIGRDNIVATQFHPEKSHKYGMKLLENFVYRY